MPARAKRSWVPLTGFTATPVVGSGGKEYDRYRKDSGFEIVDLEDQKRLWSQRIISDAHAMVALASSSAQEQILHVELGQNDRAQEHELDLVITELSAENIVVYKSIGDKKHTIWKVGSSTDSVTKPAWRYRYPRKPSAETIPPNPNTVKDNGPPRKTRRSIRRKFERSNIIGKFEMTCWKRAAGKRKEWRSYRHVDINKLQTERTDGSESHPDVSTAPWLFSNSAVPLSLLRSHGQSPVQERKIKTFQRKRQKATAHTLKLFEEEIRLEQAKRIWWRKQSNASWTHHSTPLWKLEPRQDTKYIPAAPIKSTHMISESSTDFLRLVFGTGGETKIVPEKFLTGCVTVALSKSRQGKLGSSVLVPWRKFSVSSFLRYDSHADVYALTGFDDPLRTYEGHLFFHEDMPGNWGKYGKRKQERLQKSQAFIGETKVNKRALVVVTINANATTKVKKSDAEFPVLPQTDTGTSQSHDHNQNTSPILLTVAF
jgi:hypothetical protein